MSPEELEAEYTYMRTEAREDPLEVLRLLKSLRDSGETLFDTEFGTAQLLALRQELASHLECDRATSSSTRLYEYVFVDVPKDVFIHVLKFCQGDLGADIEAELRGFSEEVEAVSKYRESGYAMSSAGHQLQREVSTEEMAKLRDGERELAAIVRDRLEAAAALPAGHAGRDEFHRTVVPEIRFFRARASVCTGQFRVCPGSVSALIRVFCRGVFRDNQGMKRYAPAFNFAADFSVNLNCELMSYLEECEEFLEDKTANRRSMWDLILEIRKHFDSLREAMVLVQRRVHALLALPVDHPGHDEFQRTTIPEMRRLRAAAGAHFEAERVAEAERAAELERAAGPERAAEPERAAA